MKLIIIQEIQPIRKVYLWIDETSVGTLVPFNRQICSYIEVLHKSVCTKLKYLIILAQKERLLLKKGLLFKTSQPLCLLNYMSRLSNNRGQILKDKYSIFLSNSPCTHLFLDNSVQLNDCVLLYPTIYHQ